MEKDEKRGEQDGVTVLTDVGADAVGAAIGTGVGLLSGDPMTAIGGTILGSVAANAIKYIVAEVRERTLSKREILRVEETLTMAVGYIQKNLEDGKCLRDDGFFAHGEGDRSTAEEIFEGTVRVAQRECEEKKLRFIARLNANIAFDDSVSRFSANQLLKLASELTYRQILILRVVGLLQMLPQIDELKAVEPLNDPRLKTRFGEVCGIENVAIASEVYALYRMSLLSSSSAVFDPAGINPSHLALCGYGAQLFKLMELGREDFINEDSAAIYALLTGAKDARASEGVRR